MSKLGEATQRASSSQPSAPTIIEQKRLDPRLRGGDSAVPNRAERSRKSPSFNSEPLHSVTQLSKSYAQKLGRSRPVVTRLAERTADRVAFERIEIGTE